MYTALRSFKVKADDGSYRIVNPGDLVPEAAGWRALRAYLDRGWIKIQDVAIPASSAHDVSVAVTRDVPAPDPAPRAARSEESAEESPSKKDLKKKSLEELRAMAEAMGMDASQPKAKLIQGILEA